MINWKLRLKNKTTLTAIVLAVIAIIYKVLGAAGIVPAIEQQQLIDVAELIIWLLVLLGVVVDPTTQGIKDSTQAMTYVYPKISLPELDNKIDDSYRADDELEENEEDE